jgi:hypothetical protein
VSFARRARPRRRPIPGRSGAHSSALLVRTLLLGATAIAGAAWALVRHYTHELPPMRVPRPAPTYDADAGEMAVPELLPTDED